MDWSLSTFSSSTSHLHLSLFELSPPSHIACLLRLPPLRYLIPRMVRKINELDVRPLKVGGGRTLVRLELGRLSI